MHYHVVEFINGCLNDYDSGPFDSLEDAQEVLNDIVKEGNKFPDTDELYVEAGEDRYERGLYILKIEVCNETECEERI
jgi:hypothetical protein